MSLDRYDQLLAEVQKHTPEEHWDLVADLDEEIRWQLLVAEHGGVSRTREGRLRRLLLRTERRLARIGT